MPREQQAELHTFIAYVEDRPGVLNRVASLFRRRAFNIESLTVGRSDRPGVSRLTVVVRADQATARRIEANLYKLVDVVRVADVTHARAVTRELALIKVRADAASRVQVLQLCEVFHARCVDVAKEALVVEVTGPGDKLDAFAEVMEQFGVLEMVRTGAVAMTRGSHAPIADERAPDETSDSDEQHDEHDEIGQIETLAPGRARSA